MNYIRCYIQCSLQNKTRSSYFFLLLIDLIKIPPQKSIVPVISNGRLYGQCNNWDKTPKLTSRIPTPINIL